MRLALFLLLCAHAALAQEGFRCGGDQVLPPARAAAKPGPTGFLQSQGRVHVLVVFAKFRDEAPARQQPPEYAGRIFDPDFPGSFSHFYTAMSQGQFQVEGTVLPRRYASDQPASAYDEHPSTHTR